MNLPRVAALQMVSGNNIEENFVTVESLVSAAVKDGVLLVVLPETFAVFSWNQSHSLSRQEISDLSRRFIQDLARRHAVWIVAGTIPYFDGCSNSSATATQNLNKSKALAACFVVNDTGEECARYDKVHLFDADISDGQGRYRESDSYKAGDHIVVIDTPVGRLGVAVCYDIRFPELFRLMFQRGVDVIAIPSAFTELTGKAHWLPLLRARAIENQCYVIGANQGGEHSVSRKTSGESVIIDGWGTVLVKADSGVDYLVADIDLARLERQRKSMPVAQHQCISISEPW
jgi:predicted amidohydrolase